MVLNELFHAFCESSGLQSIYSYSPSSSSGIANTETPCMQDSKPVNMSPALKSVWSHGRSRGDISTLVQGRTIQRCYHLTSTPGISIKNIKFMSQDKVKAAWKNQQWKTAAPQQHHTTQFLLNTGNPMHSSWSHNQKTSFWSTSLSWTLAPTSRTRIPPLTLWLTWW